MSQIADRLTAAGNEVTYEAIKKAWQRTVGGGSISVPMPEPVLVMGVRKQPFWLWREVEEWWGRYAEAKATRL